MSQPTKSAKEIFLSAVDKSDPSQREAYLREACGTDIQRRRHVEALLRAHGEPDSLLDQERINAGVVVTAESCADTTLDLASLAERPGATIGRYTLLEEIGEGGMGVVYMAEQREPVRRKVALKIIKPGMDTRQVIARFEAERQALAMMEHPNIAHVFDGGATDSGRPYFVMELVRGMPITQYCDEARRTTDERLQLFILVCDAVHHGTRRGSSIATRQAVQHPGHAARRRARAQDHRLRNRQGRPSAACRDGLRYGPRPNGRHADVHEPGAGRDERIGRRHAKRHLLCWACCSTILTGRTPFDRSGSTRPVWTKSAARSARKSRPGRATA